MKLLLLTISSSRNAGGLYNSVRNLGLALLKRANMYPTVVAFSDEFSDQDRHAYLNLPLIEYAPYGPGGISYSPILKSIFNKLRPNIVHAQGIYTYSSYVNFKYCSKNNIPYLISPRGMLDKWILNTNPLKKKLVFALYEKKHLANANCIHALGIPEYNAIRNFGCKQPIAIVPNGVFLPSAAPQKLNIPAWKDNRKVLLFISRLHPKKGLENLLQAWAETKKENENWKLIIAGESANQSYTSSLTLLATQLNLLSSVAFIGMQLNNEKNDCFRNADAFILPSFSEGMPMAVLEAWSYGLPTLITPECNLQESFEINAAIKISANVESIKLGLKQLFLLSDEERKSIGLNGLNMVKSKYTWDIVAKDMSNLYNWILGKCERPEFVKLD